jgi:hypothetical protein
MAMLAVVFGGAVLLAFVITVDRSFDPFNLPQFVSALILGAVATFDRLRALARRLESARRQEVVASYAQDALISMYRGVRLRDETVYLTIHVWEVPRLYRWVFRFGCREWLRAHIKRTSITKRALRFKLKRTAAVGLIKPKKHNVKLAKGRSLVGVCIAYNKETQMLSLDTRDAAYAEALESEDAWDALGSDYTHGLDRDEAVRLAEHYKQVLAQVVQSDAGEAIGCVTASARVGVRGPDIFNDQVIRDELSRLAQAVAPLLVVPTRLG